MEQYDMNNAVALQPVTNFAIAAEKVAHVNSENSLEHALLVLTKTGYSAIPVLTYSYKLQGLISMPQILDTILGLEKIEFEKLEDIKVKDVMQRNIPKLNHKAIFKDGFPLLVDNPFVCIVDEEEHFQGIFTRREALKLCKKRLFQSLYPDNQ